MERKGSEVAQLRQQLELEAQAMQQALHGFAISAQHAIIDRKYRAFGASQQQLVALIGEEEAATIATDIYIKVIG